jgi:hypothetical protein
MPVERVSLTLRPFGFFDANPALDVPPTHGPPTHGPPTHGPPTHGGGQVTAMDETPAAATAPASQVPERQPTD